MNYRKLIKNEIASIGAQFLFFFLSVEQRICVKCQTNLLAVVEELNDYKVFVFPVNGTPVMGQRAVGKYYTSADVAQNRL